MRTKDQMHDYQKGCVRLIKEKKRFGLFLDMGAGKTTISLTAYADLLEKGKVKKVLIIAPLRVANNVWHAEAKQWEHLQHLKFSIATGTVAKRKAAIEADADFYVINRENIPWLCDQYQPKKKWPFDAVILDEASSFKSRKSSRFKKLRNILPYTDYITLLTGTPSPNGYEDLWTLSYMIDFGARLGKSFQIYKDRFFDQVGFKGYELRLKKGADKQIKALMEDIVANIEKPDLGLKEPIYMIEKVVLPPAVRASYKSLERDFLLTIGEQDFEAVSAATLVNKLLQMANGAIYDEDGDYTVLHKEKIKVLKELVEDHPNENFLIAYNFKFDKELLTKAFPEAVVLDNQPGVIERWNAGKIKMLLAHPASAGHGLNLQGGGSNVIWYGMNWSLELYQQFNARLFRQGQKETVKIVHLIAEGTVDEKVHRVLKMKDVVQSSLLNHLKRMILEDK